MPLPLNCPSCGEANFLAEDTPASAMRCRSCGASLSSPASAVAAPNPFAQDTAWQAPQATRSEGGFASNFSPPAPVRTAASDNPYMAPAPEFSAPAIETDYDPNSVYGRARRDALLADRFTRWLGAFLDTLCMIVVMFGAIFLTAASGTIREEEEMQVVMYGAIFAVMVLQSVLITMTGQTIGKMVLGTKIVNKDDEEIPGFFRGVLVRTWLTAFLGFLPAFGLIDAVWIFGDERRCLHDVMAGTRVIKVRR